VQRAAITQVGFEEGTYARNGGVVGILAYLHSQKIGPIDGLLDTPPVGHHGKPQLRDTVAVDFFTVSRC
jgi:hypothetical protein